MYALPFLLGMWVGVSKEKSMYRTSSVLDISNFCKAFTCHQSKTIIVTAQPSMPGSPAFWIIWYVAGSEDWPQDNAVVLTKKTAPRSGMEQRKTSKANSRPPPTPSSGGHSSDSPALLVKPSPWSPGKLAKNIEKSQVWKLEVAIIRFSVLALWCAKYEIRSSFAWYQNPFPCMINACPFRWHDGILSQQGLVQKVYLLLEGLHICHLHPVIKPSFAAVFFLMSAWFMQVCKSISKLKVAQKHSIRLQFCLWHFTLAGGT